MKSLLKVVLFSLCVLTLISCSKDETPQLQDTRSFVTNEEVDFFINRNGTVDLIVTGNYIDDGTFGEVIQRGFVYGNTSLPIIGNDNTETALGAIPVHATLGELPFGKTFYIRGYFELSDGTFFYGDEIMASTEVDATQTRSVMMAMEPEAYMIHYTWLTPILSITELLKESPAEIGFEYSLKNDFSNSEVVLEQDLKGSLHINSYSEAIENLTSGTKYYIRPYAKYADGAVTNGGNSVVSFITDNY